MTATRAYHTANQRMGYLLGNCECMQHTIIVFVTGLEDTHGEKQTQTLDMDAKSVRILRFRIDESFDDFPTIHSIVVEA